MLFFGFFVIFWDREKGEWSWFGSKLYFYLLKTSILRDLPLSVLTCTIFEAKQQKRKQKRFLVCVDITMMIN